VTLGATAAVAALVAGILLGSARAGSTAGAGTSAGVPAAEAADTAADPGTAGFAPKASGCSPEPSESAGPSGAPEAPRSAGRPSDVLDLKNWYLGLPTGEQGSPDNVEQPDLDAYSSEWFRVNEAGDGVVFRARADGVHTSGSQYPRSELREMDGDRKASWDGSSGTHTMVIKQAITATPKVKPDVIAGQIHATSDDLMQVKLSGSRLTVTYDDGDKTVDLNPDYTLGTVFTVKIESSGGRVKVWYDGAQKADLDISSSTSYFKAGAYVNSNTEKGDEPDAYGEVVIYDLTVTHSG
jgi:hypothetical protein